MPDSDSSPSPEFNDETPDLDPSAANGGDAGDEESTSLSNGGSSRRYNDLNKRHLADLAEAESVALAALDEERLVMLAPQEIDEAKLNGIVTRVQESRALGNAIVAAKEAKQRASETEQKALEPLMKSLREVQRAVKRKFPQDKIKWRAYRIGKSNFGGSRVDLEQDANVILNLAESDALPGVTAERITAIRAELTAWKAADEAQSVAAGKVTDLLRQFDQKVGQINTDRRNIQYAADTVWPYDEAMSQAARRSFKLPQGRPMT